YVSTLCNIIILYSAFVSFLVHISLLELVFTSGHIYTSPPTATYHGGGRWLCQAVNTNRQLPAGAVPFFLPLLRCLHGQNH
uniref:Uncharacterized protein n=1 Tax=Aegilops tauschii subsp. strangulata TaxID=200361 RepID=A0A452XQP1_AEGTS